jgi:hypothetical protein
MNDSILMMIIFICFRGMQNQDKEDIQQFLFSSFFYTIILGNYILFN